MIKRIPNELRISLVAVVCLTVLLCGLYPAVVWLISQGLFPYQANGSLITVNDRVSGSKLLAQQFTSGKYFHPRPSVAGDGYDAANSGGSNLGPTSKKLIETVRDRVADYRKENGLNAKTLIPADAVTASASGLDPHISVKNALIQSGRVAKARGLSEDAVNGLIRTHTEGRDLGIFGEPRVNVLLVNRDLDKVR